MVVVNILLSKLKATVNLLEGGVFSLDEIWASLKAHVNYKAKIAPKLNEI